MKTITLSQQNTDRDFLNHSRMPVRPHTQVHALTAVQQRAGYYVNRQIVSLYADSHLDPIYDLIALLSTFQIRNTTRQVDHVTSEKMLVRSIRYTQRT